MALPSKLTQLLARAGRARALPPGLVPTAVVGLLARRFAHRLDELEALIRAPMPPEVRLARAVGGTVSADEAVPALDAAHGRDFVTDRDAWATALRSRHPREVDALVATADAALAGRYLLFGRVRQLGRRPRWAIDSSSGARWPLEPGRRLDVTPGGGADVKRPWELARLQVLPAVGAAYALTGDERYPAFFVEHAGDFLAENPAPLGPHWVSAMEVGLRAASLARAHGFVRESSALTPAFKARFYAGILDHANYLARYPDDVGWVVGNHHVCGLTGLAFLGCGYPAFRDAAGWRTQARRGLAVQLARQVLPDGGPFEASVAYHRLVLECFAATAHLDAVNGRPLEAAQRQALRRGLAFAAAFTRPDGWLVQLGDNDSGRLFRFLPRPSLDARHLESLVAKALGEPAAADDAEAMLVSGPGATAPPTTTASAAEARVFPDAGMVALRAGGVRAWMTCGPNGQRGVGGHSHCDKLAFELWLGDGALVVDPGTGCYASDPARRNAYRSTRAHATLMLDGADQSPLSADLFFLPDAAHARITDAAADGRAAWVVGHHLGYLRLPLPVTHERTLRVDAGGCDVEDRLDGDGAHDVLATVPLAPGARARIATSSVHDGERRVAWVIERPGLAPALVVVRAPAGLAPSIEDARYSPGYDEEVPAFALRLRGRVTCPARLAWRFTLCE